jgi:hypothetical protein
MDVRSMLASRTRKETAKTFSVLLIELPPCCLAHAEGSARETGTEHLADAAIIVASSSWANLVHSPVDCQIQGLWEAKVLQSRRIRRELTT